NLEDRLALKRIAEIVIRICEEVPNEAGQPEIALGGCLIARAEDINRGTTRREYGKASFLLPEFEQINSAAYFDYQREKVFLRTNKVVRSAIVRREESRKKRLPINRTIEVRCKKCPHCGEVGVIPVGQAVHTKLAYDLKFTRSGINRQVIACTCVLHR